jgi:hypothetical protein
MNLTVEDGSYLVTILGVFLAFSSFTKVYTYYKMFGIYIISYIELSETVVLFMENFLAYLIIALIVTIVSLHFYYNIQIDSEIGSISKHFLFERFEIYYFNLKANLLFLLPH